MKIKKLFEVKLKATKAQKISKSKIFSYIDSDFKDWGCDEESLPSPEMNVEVYELIEDATFTEMMGNPPLCFTQSQIIEFCKNHKEKLREDGWATFFPFKVKEEFFVARVHRRAGGLKVCVGRFSRDRVWDAGYRDRLVFPQLNLGHSALSTLKPSESLTLDQAIKICKDHGLLVYESK